VSRVAVGHRVSDAGSALYSAAAAWTICGRGSTLLGHNVPIDPALLPQLLAVLGTIAGALVGGLTAYAAGVVKSRSDLRVAEWQVEAQLAISDGARQTQIAIDRDRQNRQKVEEAYGHLMEWLYDIEATIEEIYSGLFTDDEETLIRCVKLIDEWPWETLRAPRYTASIRYLWSAEVSERLGSFMGKSANFTAVALHAYIIHVPDPVMRRCAPGPTADNRAESRKRYTSNPTEGMPTGDVWRGRCELLNSIADVRVQVRREMFASTADE
jgi:hypothetical protein